MFVNLIFGLAAAMAILWAIKAFSAVEPRKVKPLLRKAGGVGLLALATLMLVKGQAAVAALPGAAGLWLLGMGDNPFQKWFGGRTGGEASAPAARSAMIEIQIEPASGRLTGMVLAGPHEGRTLDQLSRATLFDLHERCLTDDPEGARLLEAYLDRRFPGWRAAGQSEGDAWRGGATGRGGAVTGGMTEDEAYQVLGLAKGAGRDEISRAHRDLMKKLHPDAGGTTALAARVNEAKDVLMRRHH